jgi:hypothetical protein
MDASTLIAWIAEREAVRRRREAGEAAPWSEDEIFQRERFCNVERERDAVTRWIRETWRDPYRDDPDVWFLMVVARLGGNDPRILAEITPPLPWDRNRYLAEMAAKGLKVGRRGYQTTLGPKSVPTHEHLARSLFDVLWAARDQVRPRPGDGCQDLYKRLLAFNGFGTFLAAQVVADTKFTSPLSDAPDWWHFVASGPGSRRGLNVVMGRDPDASWSESNWLAAFRRLRSAIEPHLAVLGLRLSASDLQNCLCELFKYHRAKTTGRIARPFRTQGTAPKRRLRKPPTPAPSIEALAPVPRALPELAAARDPAAAHVLFHDIETRSKLDLKKAGAWRYAADASTAVRCLAYAVDHEPVQMWIPGEPVPTEFIEAASSPNWLLVAHNAQFERAIAKHILGPRHGFPQIDLARQRCTLAMALACALPGKLEKAAEVLGLPHQKDAEGARLMRQLSRPLPDGTFIEDAALLERLCAYCAQDVEVERAVYHRLPPLSDAEQALWQLDAVINARGFYTDGPLLEAASRIAAAVDQAAQAELVRVTDGAVTSTDKVAKLQTWLATRGCKVEDISKGTLKAALRRKDLAPAARRVIELRLATAQATAAKVDAMLAWRCADERVHGSLQYHGSATGRWAGRGPQPQNFRRDTGTVDQKIAAIMAGGPATLDDVADAARGAICAAPGHRFLIGDFSGIESRVLAWIAEERTKLAQWIKFDATGDPRDEPYFILGKACDMPDERARQGKFVDLAFGYQGGIAAYAGTTYEGDPSTKEDRERFKQVWRNRHPHTVAFWHATDRAAIRAVRTTGTVHAVKRVSFTRDADFLTLTLPSGRMVRYPQPRIIEREFNGNTHSAVSFMDTALGKWGDCNYGRGAYGGLWTENIVQAIARDLLAEAMQRLEAAGYPIVLTVHDEIVAEVQANFGSLEEFKRLLVEVPAWAEGMPISAKTRQGLRFNKPAEPRAADAVSGTDDSASDVSDTDAVLTTESAAEAAAEVIAIVDGISAPIAANDAVTASILGAGDNDDDVDGDDAGPAPIEPGRIDLPLAAAAAPCDPEPPPSAFTWDDVRAAFEQPHDEAPKSNGHDGNVHDRDSARNRDGYPPHGARDRDTGCEVAFYTYCHADGSPYLGVKRTTTKQFPQYHWTGTAWAKGAPKGLRIPYRLPELVKAPLDAWVLICAGEKDADSAAALGFTATTNPEGERKGAWVPELNAWFAGRKRVAIMEDNDATGQAHAAEVTNALRGIVPDIRIVPFRELPEHGDLTDWLEQGNGKEDLQARIDAAKPDRPKLKICNVGELLGSGLPPPRGWLYGRQLCRRFLSGLVAPGDAGKTTLRLTQAIELASNRELLGHRIYQRCRVLIVSLEDDHDELWRRLMAACRHHSIDRSEIDGWLFSTTVNGPKLVERIDREVRLGTLDGMLRESIQELRPDLLVLDPFVKLHALVENDNADMDFVCTQLVKIAHNYDIAVDCPAHTRKGELEAGNSDNRRGASAQRDAGRLDYTLTHMTEDEAKRFGIDLDERKDYVRLDRAKANIVRRSMKASWFRMASVRLGNATEHYPDGDEVQAIEAWVPPAAWAGVTDEEVTAILDAIASGLPNGQRYSSHNRAKERAAWLVVLDHCTDKTEAQCQEIIRTWLKSGVLVSKNYDDPERRNKVKGLFVDEQARARAREDIK